MLLADELNEKRLNRLDNIFSQATSSDLKCLFRLGV